MFYADNFCKCEEVLENGQQFYVFSGLYKDTRQTHSVKVSGKALYHYRQGALIQDAFPELSREDREFLVSGISPEEWERMFSLEPDEDDEES